MILTSCKSTQDKLAHCKSAPRNLVPHKLASCKLSQRKSKSCKLTPRNLAPRKSNASYSKYSLIFFVQQ
nr:hypothetical protein [Spiroplasma citri]